MQISSSNNLICVRNIEVEVVFLDKTNTEMCDTYLGGCDCLWLSVTASSRN